MNKRLIDYMKEWCFDHFSQLFDLFLTAADITVSDIRFVLDLHHSHRRINLWRQWNMDLIFVAIDTDSHAFLDISRRYRIGQIDDKLRELFHINDILCVFVLSINDLGTSRHLQGLFVLKRLFVSRQIPESRWRQTCVRLFNSRQFVNAFEYSLDLVLNFFDGSTVLTRTLSTQLSHFHCYSYDN